MITFHSHRSSTNSRMSFSSKTDLSGSQVDPLRLHIRNVTSTALARSNTRNRGSELKKVKKSTHPEKKQKERQRRSFQHSLVRSTSVISCDTVR